MLHVLRRAWRDTKQSIGLKWQTLVHYVVVPGLTVLLLWFLLGKEQAMDEIWIVGCYLAVAFLLLVFSFLWNLWLAPYRLINEKMDQRGVRRPLSPDYRKPNVKNWEGTKTFKLGDAACLWVGVRPRDPIEEDQAAGKFAQLSGAMMSREIPYNPGVFFFLTSGKEPWPTYAQSVSAVSLRRYADQIGDVPPFLQSVVVPQEPEKEVDQDETDA